MANSKYGPVLLITFFLFYACATSQFSEENLHGQWKVQEWKVNATGKTIQQKMDMTYDPDGKYAIDYGQESESGKYWIMGDFLHTIETDQVEKKVKIVSLTNDSLLIQMNRGGEIESVTFLKS